MAAGQERSFRRRLAGAGRIVGLVVAVVAGIVVGAVLRAAFAPAGAQVPAETGAAAGAPPAGESTTRWTCAMHPQINLPKPGRCPICNMALIPLEARQADTGSLRQLTVSENARRLMDIETSPVERRFVEAEIRMVGKIDYDETRLKYITAWIPGRLDRLYVDYTGVPVKEGDHMVYLYSPELLGAQEELLQAVEAVKSLADSGVGIVRQTTEATLSAAREKLRLWGLKPEQIAEIEKTGRVTDHVTIYAPAGGIVVHKNAQEGMYVNTGTRIYTIADLSRVWARLDAYESDLMWLRYGQKVEFTAEAYPGRTFTGTIAFIDPILTQTSRTVKVRVNVPNPGMLLKPGMFVRAVVRSRFDAAGRAMDPALAGKWICPMHPEIVKEGPGKCDICQMDLVRTESLGYVGVGPGEADKPLVIPASAALLTGGRGAGSRAVVYVEIDPSLLRATSVTRWRALPAEIRRRLGAGAGEGEFLNARCPIMGTVLDLSKVADDLTRRFDGKKVAFCCPGCPGKWDKLSEAEKRAKLAAVASGRTPLGRLWGLLSAGLRKDLLAVADGDAPPAEVQDRFIDEVNAVLRGTELYDANTWRGVALCAEAEALIKEGVGRLPPRKLHRLNRLLIEALLPGEIAKARFAPTFVGREIVLGPRAGEYYLVRRGLAEGQRVVTKGAFKIDAELQISAKPSMMTPEGGRPAGGHHHGHGAEPGAKGARKGAGAKLPAVFLRQLHGVLAAGRKVRRAVASGEADQAKLAFAALGEAVKAVGPEKLAPPARLLWQELSMLLANDAVEGTLAKDPRQTERVVKEMDGHLSSMKSKFGLAHGHSPAPAAPGEKGSSND